MSRSSRHKALTVLVAQPQDDLSPNVLDRTSRPRAGVRLSFVHLLLLFPRCKPCRTIYVSIAPTPLTPPFLFPCVVFTTALALFSSLLSSAVLSCRCSKRDREDINSVCLTVVAQLLEKYDIPKDRVGRIEVRERQR